MPNLSETLNIFMVETTRVFTELAVTQKHLSATVKEVSEVAKNSIESNIRLEEKIISLETKAIDRLNVVESLTTNNLAKIEGLNGRVQTLEIINGRQLGRHEGSEEKENKWTRKWARGLGLVMAVVAVASFVYTVVSKSGS